MTPKISKLLYEKSARQLEGSRIIGFRGEAGVGKDTIANAIKAAILCESIPFNEYAYEIMAALTGKSVEFLKNDANKSVKSDYGITYRELIVQIIEQCQKDQGDSFPAFLLHHIVCRRRQRQNSVLLIPSVRRPVELSILNDVNALLVTVKRPNNPYKVPESLKSHVTEMINQFPYKGVELILTVGEGEAHIQDAFEFLLKIIKKEVAIYGKTEYITTTPEERGEK